ncbi:MAG: transcriptional regulator [Candidatus Pseudobacter hemicellulosilyticus]|uniref:Transcriptional regulator n=1 Tax=Candidatus Pseudobacter hemicellulosilyticus TaxID=3121375 RepID=A0AAJ6BFY3_9BACT|nr:MAG: transcriptional regulator [Pseudobacter sp.]
MKKSISDRILLFLKMKGEAEVAALSEELQMTKEGIRQQLLKMVEEGLVSSRTQSKGVGRPITYYAIAEKGTARFPDSHAEVTVQLLQSVKKLLGENALDLLISEREKQTLQRYETAMAGMDSIDQRLDKLSQIRSEEGYMATWKKENEEYFLVENHCPICAAATECQGFCRAELKNFQQLIGQDFDVDRVQHIISDGQRCVYRIREKAGR